MRTRAFGITLLVAALLGAAGASQAWADDVTPPVLEVPILDDGGYILCGLFDVYARKGTVAIRLDEPATLTVREVGPLGLTTERRQSLPAGVTQRPSFAFPMVPLRWPLPGRYKIIYSARNAAGLTTSTTMRFSLRYATDPTCSAGSFAPIGPTFTELPNGARASAG